MKANLDLQDHSVPCEPSPRLNQTLCGVKTHTMTVMLVSWFPLPWCDGMNSIDSSHPPGLSPGPDEPARSPGPVPVCDGTSM